MSKPVHWLAPAAALVLAVAWLWSQQSEIARRTDENTRLRANLAENHSAVPSEPPRSLLAPLPTKRPDARMIMRSYAHGLESLLADEAYDPRVDNACDLAMAHFTPEDCAAALDELDTLDLPRRARYLATGLLSIRMAQITPELVFGRYLDQSGEDPPKPPPMRSAFEKWADRDPLAAAAWMDKAVGTDMFAVKRLDGKSDRRVEFEGTVVRSMMADHPSAAESRLTRVTALQQEAIFKYLLIRCPESQRDAVQSMISRLIPDPETRERIQQSAESDS